AVAPDIIPVLGRAPTRISIRVDARDAGSRERLPAHSTVCPRRGSESALVTRILTVKSSLRSVDGSYPCLTWEAIARRLCLRYIPANCLQLARATGDRQTPGRAPRPRPPRRQAPLLVGARRRRRLCPLSR